MSTYFCRKCGQLKPVSMDCPRCGRIRMATWRESRANRARELRTHADWQKTHKSHVARYYRRTVKDPIIAPRYVKPPRYQAHLKSSECDRCPSHLHRCKVYVKIDLPLDCESLRESDLVHLKRGGECLLQEIGWLDRTKTWDKDIWERYYEAEKEMI